MQGGAQRGVVGLHDRGRAEHRGGVLRGVFDQLGATAAGGEAEYGAQRRTAARCGAAGVEGSSGHSGRLLESAARWGCAQAAAKPVLDLLSPRTHLAAMIGTGLGRSPSSWSKHRLRASSNTWTNRPACLTPRRSATRPGSPRDGNWVEVACARDVGLGPEWWKATKRKSRRACAPNLLF